MREQKSHTVLMVMKQSCEERMSLTEEEQKKRFFLEILDLQYVCIDAEMTEISFKCVEARVPWRRGLVGFAEEDCVLTLRDKA